jgi:hypothetical protein
VRPFPAPAGERQIPTEGDTQPAWVLNSRELFYRNGDKMMAAVVETKDVRYGQTQVADRSDTLSRVACEH